MYELASVQKSVAVTEPRKCHRNVLFERAVDEKAYVTVRITISSNTLTTLAEMNNASPSGETD
jgi:hypothetical protein